MPAFKPHTKYALVYLLVIVIASLFLTSIGTRPGSVDPILGAVLSIGSVGLLIWFLFVLVNSLIDDRIAELERGRDGPATSSKADALGDAD